MFFGEYKQ
jgi:hypothetical protein